MRKVNRKTFLSLPENTVYSKVDERSGETCYGLFKKCNEPGVYTNDWNELELVPSEVCWVEHPKSISDGSDIQEYGQELADSGKDFRLDYTAVGRDGRYEENEMFVVWDSVDINKLIEQLKECSSEQPQ